MRFSGKPIVSRQDYVPGVVPDRQPLGLLPWIYCGLGVSQLQRFPCRRARSPYHVGRGKAGPAANQIPPLALRLGASLPLAENGFHSVKVTLRLFSLEVVVSVTRDGWLIFSLSCPGSVGRLQPHGRPTSHPASPAGCGVTAARHCHRTPQLSLSQTRAFCLAQDQRENATFSVFTCRRSLQTRTSQSSKPTR